MPLEALGLFSWRELQTMVCGRAFAAEDVKLLKKMTEYSGCNASDQHIKWFWEVLEEDFNDHERELYLVFSWGRSRLPQTEAEFDKKHKLHSRSGGDNGFPMGHTCFFQSDLPRYSSRAVLAERVRTAITMCGVIDGD